MEDLGLDPGQGITEVARTVMKNTDFSKESIGYVNPGSIYRTVIPTLKRDIEMQRTILKAQLEQELKARSVAAGSATKLVLSDRSAIDPVAYAVLTAANKEDERQRKEILVDIPEFQDALRWYREGMFILFKPVSEWLVDDGVRSMDARGQNLDAFRGLLEELDIPFVELGGEIKNIQARVEFAKRLIKRMVRMLVHLRQNPDKSKV